MNAAELLKKAALSMSVDNWCKGSILNGSGKMCAIGHLLEAAGVLGEGNSDMTFDHPAITPALDALAEDIRLGFPDPELTYPGHASVDIVWRWNDFVSNDMETVKRQFEATSRRLLFSEV